MAEEEDTKIYEPDLESEPLPFFQLEEIFLDGKNEKLELRGIENIKRPKERTIKIRIKKIAKPQEPILATKKEKGAKKKADNSEPQTPKSIPGEPEEVKLELNNLTDLKLD